MTATVEQAAQGIKTRLDTIDGLRCFDHIPDMVTAPMAYVAYTGAEYHQADHGGGTMYELTVTLIVGGRASERTAQAAIYGYASYSGATSIRAAIEGDRQLANTVADCVVSRAGGIEPFEHDGAAYLATDFFVAVHA